MMEPSPSHEGKVSVAGTRLATTTAAGEPPTGRCVKNADSANFGQPCDTCQAINEEYSRRVGWQRIGWLIPYLWKVGDAAGKMGDAIEVCSLVFA